MDMNTTQLGDLGSGSNLDSMMMNVSNASNFSCLARDLLSSTEITNRSVWQILPELQAGAPAVATVAFIFFVISFFWNLFIIVTYLVKFRLLKEPGNIFLFTLAIYDLVASVVMTLFTFIIEVEKEYIFGNDDVTRCNTCDLVGFFFVFVVSGSLHLLTALSVDRFILLSRPLRYKKIMNAWKAIIIVICITFFSMFVALFPIIFGFGQFEFNVRFGVCIARFSGESRAGFNNFFYFLFLIMEALIPIAILSATNVFTFRLVRKFFKRNYRRRSTYRKREEQSQDKKKHKEQQNQLVKVFGALFIANAISWSVIIICVLLVLIIPAEVIPDEIYIFGWICYLTNPLFHPILESFFVKDLRLVINRAKKEVRRASTMIYRQSTKAFGIGSGNSALDEANERMDREEKELNSTALSSSMVTDAMELTDIANPSPILTSRFSTGIENGDTRHSLVKVGRSVTFSEEVHGPTVPETDGDGLQRKPNSVLKKRPGTKRIGSPPLAESIVEEEDEDEFEIDKDDELEKTSEQGLESELLSESSKVPNHEDETATENGVTLSPESLV